MNLDPINSLARWQTWLLIALGCAVAGGLLALVVRTIAYATGYSVSAIGGPVLGEAALGLVALGGFVGAMGLAQWVVLRRQAWASRWLLANALGGSLAGSLMLGLMAAIRGGLGEGPAAFLSVAVGLAAFGVVTWLMLRRHLGWADKLAMISPLALIGSMILGAGLIGSLVGAEVASGAGFGLIYGAVTGGTIVKFSDPFVHQPVPEAS